MLLKSNPLYFQIKNIIKDRIVDGVYPKDSYLPTENEFVTEFKVSLVTVRKAIELLQSENYVKKMSGKGTIVITNNVIAHLAIGRTFSQILQSKFDKIEKKIVTNTYFAKQYEFFARSGYTLIERIYYVDNKPYIFVSHFLQEKIDLKNDSDSLYRGLHLAGINLARFNDKFCVTMDKDACQMLECDASLLRRTRFSYDDNDNLCEVSVAFYNTQIMEYESEFIV